MFWVFLFSMSLLISNYVIAHDATHDKKASAYTSIHDAVKANDFNAVEQYIKEDKTSINAVKLGSCYVDWGYTANYSIEPLHCAICENLTSMAKYLIDNGADVNARFKPEKLTPLHMAAEANNLELVQYLVEHGAKVCTKRGRPTAFLRDRYACLSALAYARDPKIITYLIKVGCDPNERGFSGRTMLMLAAAYGYIELVRCLINNGADVNLISDLGETALSLATHNHRAEIIKCLNDKMAIKPVADVQTKLDAALTSAFNIKMSNSLLGTSTKLSK